MVMKLEAKMKNTKFLILLFLLFASCVNTESTKMNSVILSKLKLYNDIDLNQSKLIYLHEYTIKFPIKEDWNYNWLNITQQILQENNIRLSFADDEGIVVEENERKKQLFYFFSNRKVNEITIRTPDFDSDNLNMQDIYFELISDECNKFIYQKLNCRFQTGIDIKALRKYEKKTLLFKKYYIQIAVFSEDCLKFYDSLFEIPSQLYHKL